MYFNALATESGEDDPIALEVFEPGVYSIEVYDGLRGRDGDAANGYIAPVAYSLNNVASFTATHAFPYPPAVAILDAASREWDTDVEHPTATQVHVTFAQPFTGKLILR